MHDLLSSTYLFLSGTPPLIALMLQVLLFLMMASVITGGFLVCVTHPHKQFKNNLYLLYTLVLFTDLFYGLAYIEVLLNNEVWQFIYTPDAIYHAINGCGFFIAQIIAFVLAYRIQNFLDNLELCQQKIKRLENTNQALHQRIESQGFCNTGECLNTPDNIETPV